MELIELLPYDEMMVIQNRKQKLAILNLLRHFVSSMIDAVAAFQAGELEKFDAQVGETSCQIRAHKIVSMTEDSSVCGIISFYPKLKSLLSSCDILIWPLVMEDLTSESVCNNSHNLRSLFLSENLNMSLSDDMVFIFTSFFLALFCKRDNLGIPYAINKKLLKNQYEISSTTADKIIYQFQEINSFLSSEYVIRLLHKVYSKNLAIYLSKQRCIGDRRRTVMPCYIITKAILDSMLSDKKLILILITNNKGDLINLIFKGQNGIFKFQNNIPNKKSHIMVFKIHTVMDLSNKQMVIREIEKNGLYNLLLANVTIHPQFSGNKLKMLRNEPFHNTDKELDIEILSYKHYYEQTKKFAHDSKIGIDEFSLFMIKHIYCKQLISEQSFENEIPARSYINVE